MSQEKDACEECRGESGGIPGNENIVDGIILCDYCHAKKIPIASPAGVEERVELPKIDIIDEDRDAALASHGYKRAFVVLRDEQLACRERQLSIALTELSTLHSKQSELKRENLELKKYAPRWVEQAKGTTHWEDCWQDHRGCALDNIADLIQLVSEYRNFGEHRYCSAKEGLDTRCTLCRYADELLK